MQVRQRVRYWSSEIYWIFNDNAHRDGDLPARYFFEYGKLDIVHYYQHNELHRTTGPAIIDYELKIKRYYYQHRKYGSLDEIQMVEVCE